jgi:hypothetical protein
MLSNLKSTSAFRISGIERRNVLGNSIVDLKTIDLSNSMKESNEIIDSLVEYVDTLPRVETIDENNDSVLEMMKNKVDSGVKSTFSISESILSKTRNIFSSESDVKFTAATAEATADYCFKLGNFFKTWADDLRSEDH